MKSAQLCEPIVIKDSSPTPEYEGDFTKSDKIAHEARDGFHTGRLKSTSINSTFY